MALLTKEAILGAEDLKHKEVKVPEWGGTVRIQTMSGSARDEYEQMIIGERQAKGNGIKHIRATLLAFTIVDDKGGLLFTASDIEALGRKSVKAMDRVFEKAAELNALGEEDVEKLAGNSEAAQSGDSISD